MRDAILQAPAPRLRCISPVVLGDELLLRAFGGDRRVPICRKADPIPARACPPSILYRNTQLCVRFDPMTYGQRHITLAVNVTGQRSDSHRGTISLIKTTPRRTSPPSTRRT